MIKAKDIIMARTQPSTGCTEPVAVAFACALARSAVGGEVEEVIVHVDPNVYKNGIAVGIPYSDGQYGLEIAAALGSTGDPCKKLQVLETISPENKQKMFKLAKQKKVIIKLDEQANGLRIKAIVTTNLGKGSALLEHYHTNLTRLTVNDKDIDIPSYCEIEKRNRKDIKISKINLQDILKLADDIDNETAEYVLQGIKMNMQIAHHGIEKDYGLCVGKKIKQIIDKGLLGDDVANYASYLTAAAVDARMGGASMPVMTNSGSGNQGLGTIIPVMAFAGFNKITDKKLIIKAVTISHMISIYVKEHTGVLSCLCGCAHGATAGAAAGVLTLLGTNMKLINNVINNTTADVTGMICDGGKPGCALKLALSSGEAIRLALLTNFGLAAGPEDGIVGITVEDSISNIGEISQNCASIADKTIIDILDEFHKQKKY